MRFVYDWVEGPDNSCSGLRDRRVLMTASAGPAVTSRPLNLKRQAPLLGVLQLVHATGQISYPIVQGHYSPTRNDAFQGHHERPERTQNSETAARGKQEQQKA